MGCPLGELQQRMDAAEFGLWRAWFAEQSGAGTPEQDAARPPRDVYEEFKTSLLAVAAVKKVQNG